MVRCKIDISQKQEICQYKKDNPLAKQTEIIQIFSKKFNSKFSKSTISEIIKDSDQYLNRRRNQLI